MAFHRVDSFKSTMVLGVLTFCRRNPQSAQNDDLLQEQGEE